MKKYILCAVFLAFAPSLVHANADGSLRDMTLQALYDYGEKLAQRHDYKEASRVFQRILMYDPQNASALAYLNKIDPGAIVHQPIVIRVSKVPMPAPTPVVAAPLPVIPPGPNADLKQEIAAQDRALDELKEEIRRMHLELNS